MHRPGSPACVRPMTPAWGWNCWPTTRPARAAPAASVRDVVTDWIVLAGPSGAMRESRRPSSGAGGSGRRLNRRARLITDDVGGSEAGASPPRSPARSAAPKRSAPTRRPGPKFFRNSQKCSSPSLSRNRQKSANRQNWWNSTAVTTQNPARTKAASRSCHPVTMQIGVTNSTRMEATSIAGLNGIAPACFIAAGQLTILSTALNGNSTTRQMRSSSGV